MWNDFHALIRDSKRFLISSHLSLDGDSVGSQIAMRWYLESLGKEVVIYNSDPVPRKFAFLSGTESFSTQQTGTKYDVAVVRSCARLQAGRAVRLTGGLRCRGLGSVR